MQTLKTKFKKIRKLVLDTQNHAGGDKGKHFPPSLGEEDGQETRDEWSRHGTEPRGSLINNLSCWQFPPSPADAFPHLCLVVVLGKKKQNIGIWSEKILKLQRVSGGGWEEEREKGKRRDKRRKRRKEEDKKKGEEIKRRRRRKKKKEGG